MAPKFLLDQLGRSRRNLGLECVDLVYLHNAAESWIPEIGYRRFLERVADVFSLYEKERSEGRLRYYGIASWTCFRVPRGDPRVRQPGRPRRGCEERRQGTSTASGSSSCRSTPAMSEALSAKSQRIADEPLTAFEAAEKLGLGVFTSAPAGRGQAAEPHEGPRARGLEGALAAPVRAVGTPCCRRAAGRAEGPGARAREPQDRAIPPLTGEEFAQNYGALLEKG